MIDHLTSADLRRIAVSLIGEEAVTLLQDAGLHIASRAQVERFIAEHKASNDRIRACARATMEAAGLQTVRTEIVIEGNGQGHLIITAPAGDEHEFARLIGETMAACFPADDGKAWKRSEAAPYDTNDVPMVAATGEEEEEP